MESKKVPCFKSLGVLTSYLTLCFIPLPSKKFQAFFWYTTIFNHNSQTM